MCKLGWVEISDEMENFPPIYVDCQGYDYLRYTAIAEQDLDDWCEARDILKECMTASGSGIDQAAPEHVRNELDEAIKWENSDDFDDNKPSVGAWDEDKQKYWRQNITIEDDEEDLNHCPSCGRYVRNGLEPGERCPQCDGYGNYFGDDAEDYCSPEDHKNIKRGERCPECGFEPEPMFGPKGELKPYDDGLVIDDDGEIFCEDCGHSVMDGPCICEMGPDYGDDDDE